MLETKEESVYLRETYLTVENAKLIEELAELAKTKKALGEAWEQVRFEQKRLDQLDKA